MKILRYIFGGACLLAGIIASSVGFFSAFMGMTTATGNAGDLSGLGIIFGGPVFIVGILALIIGVKLLQME